MATPPKAAKTSTGTHAGGNNRQRAQAALWQMWEQNPQVLINSLTTEAQLAGHSGRYEYRDQCNGFATMLIALQRQNPAMFGITGQVQETEPLAQAAVA